MTAIEIRVAIAGDLQQHHHLVDKLRPHFSYFIGPAPELPNRAATIWSAVDDSLRRMNSRIACEGRRRSVLSVGTPIDDWVHLVSELSAVERPPHHDRRFARRYQTMQHTLAVDHCRRNYDVIITDPDDTRMIESVAADVRIVLHRDCDTLDHLIAQLHEVRCHD